MTWFFSLIEFLLSYFLSAIGGEYANRQRETEKAEADLELQRQSFAQQAAVAKAEADRLTVKREVLTVPTDLEDAAARAAKVLI